MNSTTIQSIRSSIFQIVLWIIIPIALTFSISAQQWNWQNPSPTGNFINSTYFVNNQVGWIVGRYGEIQKTTDGGIAWQKQSSGTAYIYHSVYFANNQVGWISGTGVLLKTTNGGKQWTILNNGSPDIYTSIKFIDTLTGWVVGSGGVILKTTDGGTTWVTQTSGTTNDLFSVTFVTGQIGWASGAMGTILKTTNGGTTWQTQTSGISTTIQCMKAIDAQTAWICGVGGVIRKTTNGGTSWQAQTSGTSNDLKSIFFSSAQIGWTVGSDGTILSTTNGGTTWTLQSTGNDNSQLNTVYSVDGSTVFTAGLNGTIRKTTNGGTLWQTISRAATLSNLYAVSFIDQLHGWASGANGSLVKTTDGGSSWISMGNIPLSNVVTLAFTTSTKGWASDGFKTYRTTDGGTTWLDQTYGAYKIKFVNQKVGYGVGLLSSVMKTIDSGATWQQVAGTIGPPNDISILDLSFVNDSTGWIVRQNGDIYKTNNSGATWQKQTSGVTTPINAVCFTSSRNGHAVCNSGVVLKTNDGGNTWTKQTIVSTDLWGVTFSDSTHGWIVRNFDGGNAGGIFYTVDGGTTWNWNSDVFTDLQYYTITSVDSKSSWIVGEQGTILKLLPSPELLTPLNDSKDVSITPTFSWNSKSGVSDWFLSFYSDTSNLTDLKTMTISDTVYSVTLINKLKPNTRYFWHVRENNANGASLGFRTFTTGSSIKITYPNGGEILAAGDSVDITWAGQSPTDTASIYYTTNGSSWILISNNAVTGKFRWKVPKVESPRCKIRYVGVDNDTSDTFFTISIPTGTASSIDFGLTTVGTSVQKTSYCISTGLALLKVQEVLFQTGTHFFLKGISRKNDSTFINIVFDPKSVGTFTDNVFIITQAGDTISTQVKGDAKVAQKLTITYPNGNEILTAKDTTTIHWTGVASTDVVQLEYSIDAGATWMLITKNATGNAYLWTLPKIESDKCLLRANTGIASKAGDIDTNFKIGQGFDGGVFCGIKQKDGKLLFGGGFRTFNLHPSTNLVRLLSDGTYDSTFQVGQFALNNGVNSIIQQTDGKILIAGQITLWKTTPVHHIVRLNSDGSIDGTFQVKVGVNAQINSIALQPDNKIVVIGQFTQFDTATANRILRLNADGTLDTTFQSGTGFSNTVDALIIDNGYIYISGQVDSYNGISGKNTYRIKSDGSNDTTYKVQKGFSGWVQYSSIQQDKKLIYSGEFDDYDGFKSKNIVRLNTDGTIDTTFVSLLSPTADKVYGTNTQSDGKIYATGSFKSYDNVQLSNFVRLYPDGKYDANFQTGTGFNSNTLGSILVGNNRIIVYGLFWEYNSFNYVSIIQLFTESTSSSADSTDAFFAISIPKGVSTTLDFGKADTATNTSKSFTLTNTGKVPLALTMLQNTKGDPFSTQDTAKLVIPEGKDYKVNISFIPTAVASYTDTMKWVTIAGDTIVSTMSGEGIASKPGVNAMFASSVVSLCQYSDTLLTVKVTGGTPPYQYTWRNKDGSVITPTEVLQGGTSADSTIRVSPSSITTYRVIVTDSKAQSDTAFVDMMVKNRPAPKLVIKGGTAICQGDSALIEVLNEANYTSAPVWSDGSIGATLWVKKGGVYFCAIDSNGCIGVSDSVLITVNPLPSVSISQVGNELVATTSDTYQWLASDGTSITGATSQKYAPPTEGNYSVRITSNGCSATSAAITFKKHQNSSSIVVLDLNFGQQVVSNIIGRNAPLRNSIKIMNNGTTERVIDSIIIKNTVFDLKKNALPRLVPPGVTVSFNTDFTPTAIGVYRDDIIVFAGMDTIMASITGEGIALPSDGVITEIELVPNKLEVAPGDTLYVYLRIKDEQPQASKATKFIANMQYDSRVLQWLPRSRQYNDEDSKRTNYWSLNVQEKRRFQGNPRLDTLMFLVKLADVDSTSLVFSDSTAFIWTDANGKVFPACRDSIVYIKVCKDGGVAQLIRFANPDSIKQVAPNPSIGNSRITLSMGITGECSVSLIDIFGRVIQEVEYARLPAGDHILQFDNASLETGTYYVVMKTGFNVSSQKISIVK